MKIKKLICILPLLLTLNGCSESEEVRSKSFIKEMGADYSDCQSISIRTFGNDEVVQGVGKTLFSAIGNCESEQNKSLFPGHLEVFAVSPENMTDDLLTLLANNRISPSCNVLCIPKNAAEFVSKNGGELSALIESSGRSGIIVPKNISAVINDYLESDKKSAVPAINDGKLTMAVTGENKLIGILTEEESKGLCWLCGTVKDIYIPLETEEFTTDFYVRKSNTKIRAEQVGENINIIIEIKINGNSQNDNINLDTIKNQTAKVVSSLCSRTIAKTVTGMKADLFGIEKSMNAARISNSKSWEEIIPNLNFYYKIKIAE